MACWKIHRWVRGFSKLALMTPEGEWCLSSINHGGRIQTEKTYHLLYRSQQKCLDIRQRPCLHKYVLYIQSIYRHIYICLYRSPWKIQWFPWGFRHQDPFPSQWYGPGHRCGKCFFELKKWWFRKKEIEMCNWCILANDMGGSINGVTQKWTVCNGKSYSKGWFGGTPHFRKPPYVCWILLACCSSIVITC
jgi:hypothetical protein